MAKLTGRVWIYGRNVLASFSLNLLFGLVLVFLAGLGKGGGAQLPCTRKESNISEHKVPQLRDPHSGKATGKLPSIYHSLSIAERLHLSSSSWIAGKSNENDHFLPDSNFTHNSKILILPVCKGTRQVFSHLLGGLWFLCFLKINYINAQILSPGASSAHYYWVQS